MSCLGPGFRHHAFKNCSLDDVLKVLREEAASHPRKPSISSGSSLNVKSLLCSDKSVRRRSVLGATGVAGEKGQKVPFFFRGTDGATSLKEELVGRVPILNDAAGFREARRLLQEEFGGFKTLREELTRAGFVDGTTSELTTGTKPFNAFARIVAGLMEQPGMESEQRCLGDFQNMFMVCCNRPENDLHWDSEEPEWIGKASMSSRHRFLTMRDLHWQFFNPIAFGLVDASDGGCSVNETVQKVALMKQAALTYIANIGGWSDKIGLFFHIFGHNSVNSLHVHMIDMAELGPTYWKYEYKNCPVDAVIKVLNEECRNVPTAMVAEAAESAVSAAVAATRAAEEMAKQVTNQQHFRRRSLWNQQVKGSAILSLVVGGERVSVPRETLLLAPAGSLLQEMFGERFTETSQQLDVDGFIYLNFPPRSFRLIIGHLQMLSLTPPNEVLEPPLIPEDLRREFPDLAWLLGMEEFMTTAQPGRAAGVAGGSRAPRKLMPRVSAQVSSPLISQPPQMVMESQLSGSNNELHYISDATTEVKMTVCGLCVKKGSAVQQLGPENRQLIQIGP